MVRTGTPYAPTQGTSIAAFNSGNLIPNGTLSQSFKTTVGDTYTLEFDGGILSYNTDPQSLLVAIKGAVLNLTKTITANGVGGGNTLQLPQKMTFVADSTLTTLTFSDRSTATNAIDFVVDNVRVTGPAPKVVQPVQLVVNGSFESGMTAWTATGNTLVKTGSPYSPTQGTNVAAFNSGNLTPNGTLSQSFATAAGGIYTLEFDAGVLAYNTEAQSLQVTANGTALLLSKTITANGIGGGTTLQLPQKLTFVADSPLTTLVFRDKSIASNAIDVVVDNVRVTGPPASSGASSSTMIAKSSPVGGTVSIGTPSLSMTDSNLVVRMSVAEPGNYIIERSSDLKNWTPISSQVLTAPGLIEFVDSKKTSTTGADAKQLFYRVGLQ